MQAHPWCREPTGMSRLYRNCMVQSKKLRIMYSCSGLRAHHARVVAETAPNWRIWNSARSQSLSTWRCCISARNCVLVQPIENTSLTKLCCSAHMRNRRRVGGAGERCWSRHDCGQMGGGMMHEGVQNGGRMKAHCIKFEQSAHYTRLARKCNRHMSTTMLEFA